MDQGMQLGKHRTQGGRSLLRSNHGRQLPRGAVVTGPWKHLQDCPKEKQINLTCNILCFRRYPLYQSAKRKQRNGSLIDSYKSAAAFFVVVPFICLLLTSKRDYGKLL